MTKLQTQRMRSRAIAFAPEPGGDATMDAEELRSVVAEWKDMLNEWLRLATEYKEDSKEIGARLEECLLGQAFELQSTYEALAGEGEASEQLFSLIDAANVLRDDIDELFLAWRNEHGRHQDLPERFKIGEDGTLTRLGIDELFYEWWEGDPERLRLVSLVLVDLDRFAKLSKAAGPRLGDVAIERFARVLQDSVRKDRGFDRVGRLRGDRFLLFLGDTSGKNAAKGAERIRQTIEASSCRFGAECMPMTASCAVLEVGKNETQEQLIQRLTAVLTEAKKAGRNLTFCDSGSGPTVVELPQYAVSSKDLQLQTS
jgi:diguanylate cyclase (GGDEF)-like protein